MDHTLPAGDPLMTGMFWGGLLLASVPILLSLGIAAHVLRRYLTARRQEPPDSTR
jgi:hypothetical protein